MQNNRKCSKMCKCMPHSVECFEYPHSYKYPEWIVSVFMHLKEGINGPGSRHPFLFALLDHFWLPRLFLPLSNVLHRIDVTGVFQKHSGYFQFLVHFRIVWQTVHLFD